VRILGKYSPFPPKGGSCPGYWITSGETGVLLECGSGVLSRAQEFISLSDITVVVLSHLHFDHMSDLMILRYAASPDGRYKELPRKVTVYAPKEPRTEFELLSYKDALVAVPVPAGTSHEGIVISSVAIGDMKVSFYPAEHSYPSYAIRFEAEDGVFAYSGDTRPCDGLLQAARGADLFLCEASAVEADSEFAKPGHLTARQAGEIAREASVGRLLLTHIWPLYDERQILEECQEVFAESQVVTEGREYRVGGDTWEG